MNKKRRIGKKSQIRFVSILLAVTIFAFTVLALNSTNFTGLTNITNLTLNLSENITRENQTENIINQTQTNITEPEENIISNITQENQTQANETNTTEIEECKENEDCGITTYFEFCLENKLMSEYKTWKCESGKCRENVNYDLVKECKLGCENDICIQENITRENQTQTENITTEIITENATITTIQYKAVIGQNVKWKKIINKSREENITLELPIEAENITIKKIVNGKEEELEIESRENKLVAFGFNLNFLKFLRNILPFVSAEEETNEAIELEISQEAENLEIEYYTPAPQAVEKEINEYKKIIIISSETHYEDILAYTQLQTEAKENSVKLYWLKQENYTYENGTENITEIREVRELINISSYDKNENGLIDYVEWVVPSLSSQVYELVIEISKAEHLDENKNFLADIYEQVYKLDNIWSEEIKDREYVRVSFIQNLTNKNDITIYARAGCNNSVEINRQNVSCEIYEKKKRIDEIKMRLGE